MKYQLVQMVEGEMHSTIFEAPPADIIAAMEVRGYEYEGPAQGPALRAILQGKPRFRGLAGPMWGGLTEITAGHPIVRYEDVASYDVLST